MRKIIPLVAALTLGGCSTPLNLPDIIKQVQQAAVVACGVVPLAETISSLFGAGFTSAFAIVQVICDQVKLMPPTTARMASRTGQVLTVGKVGDIPITVKFER